MGYGKVLASSAQRDNLAKPADGYPTVAVETMGGQMLSIDPAFVGALGAKTGFNSEGTGRLDYLNTGARIVQDTVTPGVVPLKGDQSYTLWSPAVDMDTSSVEALAASLSTIFGGLQVTLNQELIAREKVRDTYLINYKYMLSWKDSGGS